MSVHDDDNIVYTKFIEEQKNKILGKKDIYREWIYYKGKTSIELEDAALINDKLPPRHCRSIVRWKCWHRERDFCIGVILLLEKELYSFM